MNDRLRIASEQLASMQHMDRADRVRAALEEADALLAAAGGHRPDGDSDYYTGMVYYREEALARLARAEAAEARAAELQAKLDEAARLARETAGEAMAVAQADTPVVVIPVSDWRRMVELTSRVFPSHRCADDDCDACREDDELKAIIEKVGRDNG